MGLGDNLMASGMAKGYAAKGKRAAFGDGAKIIWDHHSETIFRNNPNIAHPGSEGAADLQWIPFYRGHRIYNEERKGAWRWNHNFRARPGEMFFSEEEKEFGSRFGSGFIVIEPNVPAFKTVAPNKQWPVERYRQVAKELAASGRDIVQFDHGGKCVLSHARQIKTPDFRRALAVLSHAALYIGPEGGLHHGAACVGVAAVVLFGGFIPPAVTGYVGHANLTGGADACGSLRRCEHCVAAMNNIGVADVLGAAERHLDRRVRDGGVAV